MWIAIPFLPPPPLSSVFPKTSQRAPEPEPSVCQGPPWSLTEPVMFGPNITGKIVAVTGGGTISGAFVTSSDANRKISAGTNAANEGWVLNASYSSDLYGNSETVQPFSLRLLPCIKF